DYFDPKSTPENPIWFMVDIRSYKDIAPPITLDEIKRTPALKNMELLHKSRLSVQAVTPQEWRALLRMRQLGE
ncbi:EVE domain-containing protein, partial [candidate division KSB1 bacterium]|nr:EVE domain-containing protein [candidate division KSB1 bacterium]